VRKQRFIFLFLVIVLHSNAKDVVAYSKNDSVKKIIYTQKDLKVDTASIQQLQFKTNLKSKYNDAAFDYETKKAEKNWWDRFKEWLSRWLASIFDFKTAQNAERFVGYLINFISILIIVVVVYLIVKSILNKEGQWIFGKNSDKKLIRYDDIESNLNIIDFEKLIQETLSLGNKRFVIRYYYLWVLKKLSENKLIAWDIEKTNSDYLLEIKDLSMRSNFANLSYTYNYIWYGEGEMNEDNFQKSITAFKQTIQSLR
jgi:hypothetical protein